MKVIQSPDSLHTLAFGSGLQELSPATYVFIYSFTLKKRFDTRVCLKKEKQKGNKNKNPSGEHAKFWRSHQVSWLQSRDSGAKLSRFQALLAP